jgi:adenylate cyclase class 2
MHLEVELKFRVAEPSRLESALAGLAVVWGESVEQLDLYWAHPARDFARTDEALRVRTVGERNWITYKGPKLDGATKTRRELELPLGVGEETFAAWREMLSALGFRAVAEVRKQRRLGALAWQGREVEVALDTLFELGTFVEFELSADEASVDAARVSLLELAEKLGLTDGVRTSYLELLLAKQTEGK